MAFDFPASPGVGQEFVAGGITYAYNGTGWTIKGGSTSDFVMKSGDTMTGNLAVNAVVSAYEMYITAAAAGDRTLYILPTSPGNAIVHLRGLGGGIGKVKSENHLYLDTPNTNFVHVLSTNASTSPSTGALVVAGGVGIGGALYAGGAQTGISLIIDRSGSAANMGFATSGVTRWYVGEGAGTGDTQFRIYSVSGAVQTLAISMAGAVSVPNTTASTSTTTGALVVTGGIGIGGNITIGNNRQIFGTLTGGTSVQFLGAGSDNVMYLGANGWAHIYTDNEIRNLQSGTTMAAQPGRIRLGFTQSNSVGIALRCFTTAEAWYHTFEASTGVLAGNIVGSGSGLGVIYATASDTRGKANRERLSLEDARDIVDALEVYDFDKDGNTIRGIGLVAQQAHGVHKSLAMPGRTDADWWQAEKAAPMPFVIANVQLLNKEIAELKRQLGEK